MRDVQGAKGIGSVRGLFPKCVGLILVLERYLPQQREIMTEGRQARLHSSAIILRLPRADLVSDDAAGDTQLTSELPEFRGYSRAHRPHPLPTLKVVRSAMPRPPLLPVWVGAAVLAEGGEVGEKQDACLAVAGVDLRAAAEPGQQHAAHGTRDRARRGDTSSFAAPSGQKPAVP